MDPNAPTTTPPKNLEDCTPAELLEALGPEALSDWAESNGYIDADDVIENTVDDASDADLIAATTHEALEDWATNNGYLHLDDTEALEDWATNSDYIHASDTEALDDWADNNGWFSEEHIDQNYIHTDYLHDWAMDNNYTQDPREWADQNGYVLSSETTLDADLDELTDRLRQFDATEFIALPDEDLDFWVKLMQDVEVAYREQLNEPCPQPHHAAA